jgi:hypothetical protein
MVAKEFKLRRIVNKNIVVFFVIIMPANVLRLMAVGLLEHSTFLTDKRLFKDTQVY